jgi:tRNA(Ile)-lysidine synthase
MAELLRSDYEFIDQYISTIIPIVCPEIEYRKAVVDIKELNSCPVAVQRYLVKTIFEKCFPEEEDFGAIHIENACKFLRREIASTNMEINDRVVLRLENNSAIFLPLKELNVPSPDWPSLQQEFEIPAESGEYTLGEIWKMRVEHTKVETVGDAYRHNDDYFKAYLDLAKLGDHLHLRCWQPGDSYQPLGMQGKKIKVSDFWINQKVPRRAKKFWPLIFSEKDLVWIPGFQPSQTTCITAETRDILVLKVFKVGS